MRKKKLGVSGTSIYLHKQICVKGEAKGVNFYLVASPNRRIQNVGSAELSLAAYDKTDHSSRAESIESETALPHSFYDPAGNF